MTAETPEPVAEKANLPVGTASLSRESYGPSAIPAQKPPIVTGTIKKKRVPAPTPEKVDPLADTFKHIGTWLDHTFAKLKSEPPEP